MSKFAYTSCTSSFSSSWSIRRRIFFASFSSATATVVLGSMLAIYIDAGKRDEFYLDLGADAFRRELEALGITDVFFELFDAKHGGIEYRYPLAIRYLAERLQ